MKANFNLLDDISRADYAFRAWGKELDELFYSSVMAMLSIMLENPDGIGARLEKKIELSNPQADLLLFDFLEEFLFFKDSEALLLKPVKIKITEQDSQYYLRCEAAGENIDKNKHNFSVDIKAVTLHKFKVENTGEEWNAVVVLDV